MHEGHRHRLAAKVSDGSTLYGHELLEVLLFNACPRKDLNATAHRIYSACGGVKAALCAEPEKLASIEGVGENMALYLRVLGECLKRGGKGDSFAVLDTTLAFKEFLFKRPASDRDEFEIFILDKVGKVKRILTVRAAEKGGRARTCRRKVLSFLSSCDCFGVFAGYKRACGDTAPTREDDELASCVMEACRLCGARMYDYCIISPDGETFSYFVADRRVAALRGKGE